MSFQIFLCKTASSNAGFHHANQVIYTEKNVKTLILQRQVTHSQIAFFPMSLDIRSVKL